MHIDKIHVVLACLIHQFTFLYLAHMSFLKQKEKIEGIEKLTTVFLGHAVPPVLYFI